MTCYVRLNFTSNNPFDLSLIQVTQVLNHCLCDSIMPSLSHSLRGYHNASSKLSKAAKLCFLKHLELNTHASSFLFHASQYTVKFFDSR